MSPRKKGVTPKKKAEAEEEFSRGDLVFAKVKGYPPWPARVMSNVDEKGRRFEVVFYGTYETAFCNKANLIPFNEETKAKFATLKRKTYVQGMDEIVNNPDIVLKFFNNFPEKVSPELSDSSESKEDLQDNALLANEIASAFLDVLREQQEAENGSKRKPEATTSAGATPILSPSPPMTSLKTLGHASVHLFVDPCVQAGETSSSSSKRIHFEASSSPTVKASATTSGTASDSTKRPLEVWPKLAKQFQKKKLATSTEVGSKLDAQKSSAAATSCVIGSASATKSSDVIGSASASKSSEVIGSASASKFTEDDEAELDLVVNNVNVFSKFSVGCRLDIDDVANKGLNITYNEEGHVVEMRILSSGTSAFIYKSGKVVCKGAGNEEEALTVSRQYARLIQKMGYDVKFCNFSVFNVTATFRFPFNIRVPQFSQANPKEASYEPELFPGARFKIDELKGSFTIFATGSVTAAAPSIENLKAGIQRVFNLVYPFGYIPTPKEAVTKPAHAETKSARGRGRPPKVQKTINSSDSAMSANINDPKKNEKNS